MANNTEEYQEFKLHFAKAVSEMSANEQRKLFKLIKRESKRNPVTKRLQP
ncbi:hypothetical protein [Brevibacillus laterosporus]|nr:hypothetical protein [Brevibacillus laterosporus]MED1667297.1 hypothetical protein [Brevibacillus laterosporus]MED1718242.1 hypothetical protein [Brevibacillus laterosporus]